MLGAVLQEESFLKEEKLRMEGRPSQGNPES